MQINAQHSNIFFFFFGKCYKIDVVTYVGEDVSKHTSLYTVEEYLDW